MRDFLLNVGWRSYNVRFRSSPELGVENAYGITLHSSRDIIIDSCYSKDQQRSTLVHEMLHAIDAYAGLELSEAQIVGLGALIWQVLRDTPGLRSALGV